MKRIVLIAGSILLGLLVLLAAVPLLFKDQIKARLDAEIRKNLSAQVRYGAVDLSLLRHFPNVTVSLENLAVTGHAPFRGDTLVAADRLGLSLDVLSLLRGGKIKIGSIDLERPVIGLKVLTDGQANYDVYQPHATANEPTSDTTKTAFNLEIKGWTVQNGRFRYDNRPDSLLIQLDGLTHEGSGDFTQDVFDLVTNTQVARATLVSGGTEYLSGKTLDADARIEINLPQNRYAFKNNTFKINDFPLHFDGWLALPDTNVTMDLRFKTEESGFKNLLSLVPGAYSERFKDLDADGRVTFDGMAKGTYNRSQFPLFALNLAINDGRFQYAGLPKPVQNIQLDLKASNDTDQLETLILDLRQFSANLGSNPIRGRMRLKGLKSFDVDADVQAKADLAELTQLFPIDSITLKGLFALNLKAKGHYGPGQFPVVNAAMNLVDGYVKSGKVPEPLEGVNFRGSLLNTSGKMADTKLTIADLRMQLQNEPFTASGTVQNFDDYAWDVRAKGALDLTRLTQLFPITDTKLAGRVDADVQSRGRYSDLKAKRYAQLPTTGTATLQNIRYETPAYPPIRVSSAVLLFSPERLDVSRATGFAGSSDVQVSGALSNYLGYFLGDEALGGTLTLVSQKFNVNEWLSDDGKDTGDSVVKKSVVAVPKNLALTLNTAVGEATYDWMPLRNLTGTLRLGNGVLKMEKLNFLALGGQFQTSGSYDTQELTKPKFDFALNLANVQVAEAYRHLTVVKALLPLAQYVLGNVNSQFKLSGLLGPDMIPKLNTLDGQGFIRVIQAAFKDNPILARLAETTKLSDLNRLRLQNVLMTTEVVDGKLKFQPFDVAFDPYKLTVSGGNGFDGSVEYKLRFDVPSGKVGTAFNQTFARWTGQAPINVDRVKFDLALGGTFKNPQFRFDGSSTANSLKETLATQVRDRVQAKAKTVQDSLNTVLAAR
ncbi:MAG: AsmA family protein, partial [Sphingobacteriaceae bacterium]|nr:AsmA family protein [Cytophagaceae bacterium]